MDTLHNTRKRTAQFAWGKDLIIVCLAKKIILCFPMSVLKENNYLAITLSIRYCEVEMQRLHITVRSGPLKKENKMG